MKIVGAVLVAAAGPVTVSSTNRTFKRFNPITSPEERGALTLNDLQTTRRMNMFMASNPNVWVPKPTMGNTSRFGDVLSHPEGVYELAVLNNGTRVLWDYTTTGGSWDRSNCGVVVTSGGSITMIDTKPFPADGKRVADAYAKAGVKLGDIYGPLAVVTTHSHKDHNGDLIRLGGLADMQLMMTLGAFASEATFNPKAPGKFANAGRILVRLRLLQRYKYAGNWGVNRVGDSDFDTLRHVELPSVFTTLVKGKPTEVSAKQGGEELVKGLAAKGIKINSTEPAGTDNSFVHTADDGKRYVTIIAEADSEGKKGNSRVTTYEESVFLDTTDTQPRDVNGVELQLIETNGHSLSDLMVYQPESGILFTGDIMMMGTVELCWSGNVEALLDSKKKILEINPGIIVPGHGVIAGPDEVRRSVAIWEFFANSVAQSYRKGMSPLEAFMELINKPEFVKLGMHLQDPERWYVNINMRYLRLGGVTSLSQLSEAQKSVSLWIETGALARYFPEATPAVLHPKV